MASAQAPSLASQLLQFDVPAQIPVGAGLLAMGP